MTRRRWLALLLPGVLAVGLALVFWRAARVHGASAVFPLDDPYIYFVYARNTAAGHFLAYNPGDGPSSGATSLLWTLLLTPGFLLGIRGTAVVPWALGLAAACLWGYLLVFALVCRRAGAGLQGSPTLAGGLLAAAATVLYSRFAWGAFSGLEVPLSALGVALFALSLGVEGWPAAPLAGALLTAVRPDLGLAAIPAVLVWALEPRLGAPAGGRLAAPALRLLSALLPPVAAAAYVLAWRHATGAPATNGMLVKTLFYTPGTTLAAILRPVPQAVLAEVRLLLTVLGHPGPWAWVLGAVALPGLLLRAGRALWVFALVGLAVEAAAFGSGTGLIQFGRYTLPFLVALELAAAASWAMLLSRVPLPLWPLGLLALAVAATTLPVGVADFAQDSLEIRQQQIAASTYIATRLPADAVILLNDAGAMNYFGGRYVLDLEGLGSNGFALPMRSGPGSVYDHLEDDLAAHPALQGRPLFFVVYPGWFPGIEAAFGTCLAQFTVADPTILGGPTAELCPAQLAPAPPGLRVADLALDGAYAYSASPPGGTWLLRLPGPGGQALTAAGRAVDGAESFTLPAVPGRPLQLTAVTTELVSIPLQVHVGRRDLGAWNWPAAPGVWETLSFTIPAADITGHSVRITLDGPERLTSLYQWTES